MTTLRTYLLPLIATAMMMAFSGQVNAQSSAWNLSITGEDQNGNQLSIEVGTSADATVGFNSGLDQYAPPAPPNGSFDFRILDGDEDYFKRYRPLTTDLATWNLSARPSGGETGRVTLSWDNTSLASSTDIYLLEYESGSGTVQIDLTSTNTQQLPEGEQSVTVIHIVQSAVSETFAQGWQQVGYPAQGNDVSPFSIFTNAIEGTFFSHNLNYAEETVFSAGTGYWIRLSEAETVTVQPPFLTDISLPLEQGWYLISGPGVPIAFSDINDPQGVLVAGSLKAYDDGYIDADSLKPGRGYWVQSTGSGTISMSADITESATKQVAKQQLADPDGFTSFRINTNDKDSPKFYLGGSLSDDDNVNPLSFSMPPLPPRGAFDIRFDNDARLVNGNNGTLIVRSPGDSLTISHTNQTDSELIFSYLREGTEEEETLTVLPDGKITISSEGITEIFVEVGMTISTEDGVEQPKRIELAQNYPNPFNPSTTISYTLPEAGSVSLEVFDMTGRRIAVLAEEFQAAGAYTYDFDASNLSSGVYMYRLKAANAVFTRKMTLIK